jgi:hypothetical protein
MVLKIWRKLVGTLTWKLNAVVDELKDLIVHNLDVTEFLDILGYDLADIIDKFEDECEEYRQELYKACT